MTVSKTPEKKEKEAVSSVEKTTKEVQKPQEEMGCCTPKVKKWTIFGVAVSAIVLGMVLAIFWGQIVHAILLSQLNVASRGTQEFHMWEKTPIPMYIEFYLFNWTNSEEVVKSGWKVKPYFEQCGPYTYKEVHYRRQIKFNDNNTVSYKTERVWHYAPEKSLGAPDDPITTVNSILATVGYIVKDKHAIVRMGVNVLLEEKRINLTVTKTADEFLFAGYDDPLLDILHKLNSSSIHVPFDKFGWFYSRNTSVDYDGSYVMNDGSDDIRKLGRFTRWNGLSRTSMYEGDCGVVGGTSGELWYPVKDDQSITVFSPDICSTLTLEKDGEFERLGVEGHKYVGVAKSFDNGTKHPEMSCFFPGEVTPSGVRNVSECKYGAPAFVSYPHFYLADPYYTEPIDGMKPNKTLHEFYIAIEPETGVPLRAQAAMQINIRLQPVGRINLLENVKEIYVPTMWFMQYAELDEGLADMTKMLLVLPNVGQYTGYGVIGIGALLLAAWGFVLYRKGWRGAAAATAAPSCAVVPYRDRDYNGNSKNTSYS